MKRWGLYISAPLGPEESVTHFSGAPAGAAGHSPIDSSDNLTALPTGQQLLCAGHLRHAKSPSAPEECAPCYLTAAPPAAPRLASPHPSRLCRAGAVPGEPGGPAARAGLLQRLLCPPRPQADRPGWVALVWCPAAKSTGPASLVGVQSLTHCGTAAPQHVRYSGGFGVTCCAQCACCAGIKMVQDRREPIRGTVH